MSDITVDSTPDGVEDQLGEDLRLSLLLAAQSAQRLIQIFDERQQDLARQSQDATRRFQAEMQAHHAAATAATQGCDQDRWWHEASPRQLAAAWQAARVWEGREADMTARVETLREGFSDRYGVDDPDQLRLVDVMATRGDSADKAARLASPLAEAEWTADQARAYADELTRESNRLRAELNDLPAGQRQFVAGEQTAGFDRHDWLTARLAAVERTAGDAQATQRQAEATADRLRAAGAGTQDPKAWGATWDIPERRHALRERLLAANVPSDAAQARLLTDRAQGMPPSAATRRPPPTGLVTEQPAGRVVLREHSRARGRG